MVMDSKKLGMIIGIGRPKGRKAAPPEDDLDDDELGDDLSDDEGSLSDEETVAAEDLISAVRSGDASAVVDAFRALKSACDGYVEEDE